MDRRDDPLSGCRGLVVAVILGAIFYAVVGAVIWCRLRP